MDFNEQVNDLIDERVQELEFYAKSAADAYWSIRKAGNKVQKIKSNLGCRVLDRGTYFSMCWFVNQYNHSGLETKVFSKYLRKGRGSFSYPANTLRAAARAWEYDAVQEAEETFSLIRHELSVLTKMRRALATQERLAEELEGSEELEEECFEMDVNQEESVDWDDVPLDQMESVAWDDVPLD